MAACRFNNGGVPLLFQELFPAVITTRLSRCD